jgi:hypothetical protein
LPRKRILGPEWVVQPHAVAQRFTFRLGDRLADKLAQRVAELVLNRKSDDRDDQHHDHGLNRTADQESEDVHCVPDGRPGRLSGRAKGQAITR